MKPVCLVIGAGAGIGGNVGAKFAKEGYHAFLCRRTDEEGLKRICAGIEAQGGTAEGRLLNAVDENSIEETVRHIEDNIGPIEVAIYNLGAQIGNRPLPNTSLKAFEIGWRLAAFGLFRLAQALAPKSSHVAHILFDGAVDAPDTIGKMMGEEAFQRMREERGGAHDGLMLPERIADTYFHLHSQHRSAWTHELDMRSFSDLAWWNH